MTSSNVRLDGVPIENYLTAITKAATPDQPPPNQTFWSTAERFQNDATAEVLEVNLNGVRLVNSLQFDLAHFPQIVTAEWYDADIGDWKSLRYGDPTVYASRADRQRQHGSLLPEDQGTPVTHAVQDSMPQIVGSIQTGEQNVSGSVRHPQHHGVDHWTRVSWRVAPFSTSRIRLILLRGPGLAPQRTMGGPSAYSLGVRSLQIGYRVTERGDVPPTAGVTGAAIGSSVDLLGSRVIFSMREQRASGVLSPEEGTAWRSEPQPVNYAVVNFYVDTRTGPQDPYGVGADDGGAGQVIDRFYIDPLTVGAHVNLYYSNDSPTTEYVALDEPVSFPISQEVGAVSIGVLNPSTGDPAVINYSATDPNFVDVDNFFLQFNPRGPWWIGLDLLSMTGPDGVSGAAVSDHPWISFGGNTLRQVGSTIEFDTASGKVCSVNIDPDHLINSPFQVCVVFNPGGLPDGQPSAQYPSGLTVVYRFSDRAPVHTTRDVNADDFGTTLPPKFSIGRYNDIANPGIPALGMRSMLLKTDQPVMLDEILDFIDAPAAFVIRPDSAQFDLGLTNNALLRSHPTYSVDQVNPGGLVGGPGDRYGAMRWTPIFRDYVLRRGFMNVPPTRAKYWKFEFTQLVAEHYETFVPINRTVKLFPSAVVDAHNALTSGSHWNVQNPGTPGIQTAINLAETNRYESAIGFLRESTSVDTSQFHTATEALYVREPSKAAELASRGWIWSYQPWSIGSGSPKFTRIQQHVYDTVTVRHETKVGFFAGLKSLQAYRLDYGVGDDTEQYDEHFHDLVNVSSSDQIGWEQNRLNTYSSSAQVVSKTFASTRPVKAIQFATIQSDAVSLLPDDGFVDPVLSDHWTPYGDASLTRLDNRTVVVNRGWASRSYGQIEQSPTLGTYSGLDGDLYAQLEGDQPNGLAGGGICSETVSPSASGRIYAAVQLATSAALSGPVRLEIVSVIGDVVLAVVEKTVSVGQQSIFYIGYRVGTALTHLTYGHYEGSRTVTEHVLLLDAGATLAHIWDNGTFAVTSNDDGTTLLTTDYVVGTSGGGQTTLTRDPSAALPDRSPVTAAFTSVWTYGDLEGSTYGSLETQSITSNVYARVVQQGRFNDTFLVKKLSVFAASLIWEFSNDDGVTWWDGTDIRNDPNGVLTFPAVGNMLRWRLSAFYAGASVSALSFRPWYGGA